MNEIELARSAQSHIQNREIPQALIEIQKMKKGTAREGLLRELLPKVRSLPLGEKRDLVLVSMAELCENGLLTEIIPSISQERLRKGCEEVLDRRAEAIVEKIHGVPVG